jgi:hypothetical protein
MDRNELINRVNRITYAIERDLDQSSWSRPPLEPGEWERMDLAKMVEKFGIYYIPYRRLRISSTTDELAKLVARSLNLNSQSSAVHGSAALDPRLARAKVSGLSPAPAGRCGAQTG